MKDKSSIIFAVIVAFFILVFTLIFLFAPKKADWTVTYNEKDKNPYGDYVLYDLFSSLLKNQKIEKVQKTLYEELSYYSYDENATAKKGNYVMISNELMIDDYDINALLEYVSEGNTAFLAANSFSNQMYDTLGFSLGHSYYDTELTQKDLAMNQMGELSLNFVNPKLKRKENFYFKVGTVQSYFEKIDSSRTTILGLNSLNQITYIRMKVGEGQFLISTTPLAFTNYNMLYRGNEAYIERALSYLPTEKTYWDVYYKPYSSQMREGELSFIMNQEPLKWAWYVMIITAIIYVIFNAKRVQRIIPIIVPLKNSTLEFVRTVSQLYYQRGNHKDIAKKKVQFFYEYIRMHYYLNPALQDDIFFKKLAGKTGYEEKEIRKLFDNLEFISKIGSFSANELIHLNQQLTEFKNGRK